MKPELQAKYLQYLRQKRGNEGFTLIELLVVVIIVGVLAAIALPNLLGQVGRARETEARNTIGALNRAQQAFYTEQGSFTSDLDALEVPVNTDTSQDYYTYEAVAEGEQVAKGNDNANNGTRDYAGATAYDTSTLTFTTVICRADDQDPLVNADVNGGSGSGTAAECAGDTEEIN